MTQQPGTSGDRCPSCGARVPEGAQWCSLCLADLRPAPAVPPPPPAGVSGVPVPPAAGTPAADPSVAGPPAWAGRVGDPGLPPPPVAPRRGAIDAPPPTGPPVVLGDVPLPGTAPVAEVSEAMLAELAAAERAARPAVLERFSTRGSRIGLMVGGTIALALVLVVVIWLLGAVFGRG